LPALQRRAKLLFGGRQFLSDLYPVLFDRIGHVEPVADRHLDRPAAAMPMTRASNRAASSPAIFNTPSLPALSSR